MFHGGVWFLYDIINGLLIRPEMNPHDVGFRVKHQEYVAVSYLSTMYVGTAYTYGMYVGNVCRYVCRYVGM